MNIAANQAIYPQTATHLPYHNGAIMQSPMQQTASMVNDDDDDDDERDTSTSLVQASYSHLGPAAPGQSTLLFNSAGQAFSIPLHAAHLQQMQQGAATMYSPDGAQYYQPVTSMTAQATGPKTTRTDRLEVCVIEHVSPLVRTILL
jgi:hypothetical protein